MGRRIQLIILDLDGTLYDLHDVMDFNYKLQVDFYSDFYSVSAEETICIFENHGIFPVVSEQSKSATEFLWTAEYRAMHGASLRRLYAVIAVMRRMGLKKEGNESAGETQKDRIETYAVDWGPV
jgi:FMN phosphatase YigB (HAD superfamily)